MKQKKSKIRKQLLDQRLKLKFGFQQKASQMIVEFLEELPQVQSARRILAFSPLKGEPQILGFLEGILDNKREVFLPRIKGDKLELIKIQNLDDLTEGTFGVMEPCHDLQATDQNFFNIILVPGVGFSEKCDRLGFGKGFYDKLLNDIQGYKIGIGYEFQVLPDLPTENHDVKMDMVVSENGVYLR